MACCSIDRALWLQAQMPTLVLIAMLLNKSCILRAAIRCAPHPSLIGCCSIRASASATAAQCAIAAAEQELLQRDVCQWHVFMCVCRSAVQGQGAAASYINCAQCLQASMLTLECGDALEKHYTLPDREQRMRVATAQSGFSDADLDSDPDPCNSSPLTGSLVPSLTGSLVMSRSLAH